MLDKLKNKDFFTTRNALILLTFGVVLLAACNLPGEINSQVGEINETRTALEQQIQQLALTQTSFAGQVSSLQEATPAPTLTQIPATATQAQVLPTDTPGAQQAQPSQDLERQLKSAKILLFEDMSASRYMRYVKEALDRENYFYLDVGSAKGWFKSQLLSAVEWDLVIAAAESRGRFGGEFFEYMDNRVEQGSALIVEYWDWDTAPNGLSQALMHRCGVEFQHDWNEPDLRVFYWLAPENPIFQQPHSLGTGLRNAPALWRGDLGDLFKLSDSPGSDPTDTILLASTHPQYPGGHAILVNCVGGRVVLQAFSSHEYEKEDVIALWQNYIYNTLKSRFEAFPPYDPGTAQPSSLPGSIESSAPAVIGQPAACGEALVVKVPDNLSHQSDLFEHHALGTFLLLNIDLQNTGTDPVQIYDQDYSIEGILNGEVVVYQPDKAATGYLYIQNGGNLYQDLVQPGAKWRTHLVFDIDPKATNLVLVLRPGSEFGHQTCEVRVSLSSNP